MQFNKRVGRLLFLSFTFIFTLMFMSGLVVADSHFEDIGYELGGELASFAKGIVAFFSGAVEGTDLALQGTEVITVFLFAVLLTMIIYSILDSTILQSSNQLIKGSASLAITLLALVGLPPGYLIGIATSYGAMGAAILVAIPFLIVFAFTMKIDNLFVARVTWISFGLYYIVIYIHRAVTEATFFSSGNVPNLIGATIGFIVFAVIPLLRKWGHLGKLEALEEKAKKDITFRQAGRNAEREEAESRLGVDYDEIYDWNTRHS